MRVCGFVGFRGMFSVAGSGTFSVRTDFERTLILIPQHWIWLLRVMARVFYSVHGRRKKKILITAE